MTWDSPVRGHARRALKSGRVPRSAVQLGTVALEGFTQLIPSAAGHEIIRQDRRDLTPVRMTPTSSMTSRSAPAVHKSFFSWGE